MTMSGASQGSADRKISERLDEIDGIRGWAAVVVLIQHFVTIFAKIYPTLDHPTFLLMNGMLAVQVFFVLSGDALSASYFKTQQRNQIDRLLLKRYPRLTMPTLVSCLVIYAISCLGLNFMAEAAPLIKRTAITVPHATDFDYMLFYSFVRVYVEPPTSPEVYHPFLWTMAIELIGSLFIFLFLYLYRWLSKPDFWLGGIAFLFLLAMPYYAGFFCGAWLGHYRTQGGFERYRQSASWGLIGLALFVLLTVLTDFLPREQPPQLLVIIAVLLVALFYSNSWLRSFFRNRLSRLLGDLSFPLYVMHFIVLASLTSYLIVWFNGRGGLDPVNVAIIILASFIVVFALAWLLRRLEIPYLRGLGSLVDYVLRDKTDNQIR